MIGPLSTWITTEETKHKSCLNALLKNKHLNMEQDNQRGQVMTTQTVYEQTSEQIADTMHKASRAASAAVEALEDSVGAARRAAKQGGYAAVEFFDDAKRRVQRHPIETVVATLAAGIAAGAVISLMLKKKPSCCATQMHEMD